MSDNVRDGAPARRDSNNTIECSVHARIMMTLIRPPHPSLPPLSSGQAACQPAPVCPVPLANHRCLLSIQRVRGKAHSSSRTACICAPVSFATRCKICICLLPLWQGDVVIPSDTVAFCPVTDRQVILPC